MREERIVLLKLIPNEGFIDQDEKQAAIARGEAFVKAIMADMKEIKVTGKRKSDAEPDMNQNITAEAQKSPLDEPGEPPEKKMAFCTAEQDKPQSMTKDGQVTAKKVLAGKAATQTTEDAESYEIQGMRVLRDVPMLETGARLDVVVRTITEPFWKACINCVDTPDRKFRVCAIGTPGIGKTTTTAVLIRLLLQQRRTVVYVINSAKMLNWYYEFIPDSETTQISVRVYPEQDHLLRIPSLENPNTYYIVDPGNTDTSCYPGDNFEPKVIIVTSPNSRHWGGGGFLKRRDPITGFFMFCPLWTLHELVTARYFLARTTATKGDSQGQTTQENVVRDPPLDVKEIEGRYRIVGGVPRHIFADNVTFENAMRLLDGALNKLSIEQARDIAHGRIDDLTTLDSDQPRSAIIGYIPKSAELLGDDLEYVKRFNDLKSEEIPCGD